MKILPTTLHQIICKTIPNYKDIVNRIIVPEDNFTCTYHEHPYGQPEDGIGDSHTQGHLLQGVHFSTIGQDQDKKADLPIQTQANNKKPLSLQHMQIIENLKISQKCDPNCQIFPCQLSGQKMIEYKII